VRQFSTGGASSVPVCFPTDVSVRIHISSPNMFKAYRMLMSALGDWHQACTRRQFCHPRLRRGISHWAKNELCEWYRSDCSWTPVVLACPQVRRFRCRRWPPLTRFERIHLCQNQGISDHSSERIPRTCFSLKQEGPSSPPAAVTSRFPSGDTSQL